MVPSGYVYPDWGRARSCPQGGGREVHGNRHDVRSGRLDDQISQKPVGELPHQKEDNPGAASGDTARALYVFLHECGHAHLHLDSRKKRHVEEMEAEKFAHEKMREHGVAVPRKETKQAKDYVARKIQQAMRSGAKRIDPEARRFAR
jgi:hypothetical protein